MMRKHLTLSIILLAGVFAVTFSSGASAQQQFQEDFTQGHITDSWKTYDGACLTAGDGTGNIPACVGLAYYKGQIQVGGSSGYLGQSAVPSSGNSQLPDPVGSGALRFTNRANNQAGGIISSGTPFPSGAGLQVIFKTETYRGDSGGSGGDGADGMSFFLMDGAYNPYDTGAFGGSLGYTCSNTNNDATLRADLTPRQYDGLAGGYLGLGIDEYGNFLNAGDNTATGFGYAPGRIGLRGAGNISWAQLNKAYPANYPSTLTTSQRAAAVKKTCATGRIWDYSDDPSDPAATSIAAADYPAVAKGSILLSSVLSSSQKIANEAAITRTCATGAAPSTCGVPITYSLKITQDGILSLAISYNGGNYLPVITKQSIIAASGALPASGFRFGFAGSTGGSTNIHEIMCFQATPADQAGTSVAVNEKEATKIATGTQAYLAYYYQSNWTGRVTASDLLYDSSTKTVSISATANWDALCNLTGVPTGNTCPTTGTAGLVNPQSPASRTMLTWNGTQGIPFEWASLSTAEQNTLDQGDTAPINSSRLDYLRGVRTNEINTSGVGLYRPRDGVLGDIIDSSPTWVGPPTSPYASTWVDKLHASDPMLENSGTQSFAQYATTAQTRLNVVYSGANDGFLHGFRTGAYDANGNYVNNSTTPNDGLEVLAYMPGAVFQTIHNATTGTLDYAGSQYSHNFYVDATPEADDLFYAGKWHTWLVGGLGQGGAAIYALDVTDPTAFSESGTAPKSTVIGEWTSSTISCVNVTCGSNMGYTYGVPVIRRLHNGNWAIIFGNGYNSTSGDAGIFIMTIDPTSGAIANTYYLSTGVAGSNGIASVAPADLDGDHITDFVYAGDLLGNVWRFDLTSSNPATWSAAASRSLLFTVPSGAPITTKPLLAISPQNSGPLRMMVEFGTGRKKPQTDTSPATYMTTAQSLYGIWDWNMAAWNAQPGAIQFASLAAPQTVGVSQLQTQTLTAQSDGTLNGSTNPVCWAGSTQCTSGNTQFGWTIALIGTAEQVIFNPLLYANSFIVNTTIPAVNSPTKCTVSTDTGNTIAVSAATGGASGFFMNTTTVGVDTNGTGTPFIVQAGGQSFALTQSNGGGNTTGPMPCTGKFCSGPTPPPTISGKRLTWIKRR